MKIWITLKQLVRMSANHVHGWVLGVALIICSVVETVKGKKPKKPQYIWSRDER